MFQPMRASFVMLFMSGLFFLLRPAAGQEVPFVAEIIDEKVSVRAGAGRSFYVVGELSGGQQVTVDEVVFGWYKIEPPDGTYSYISRAFVDAFGDGKTGKVNTVRAAVRAASIKGTEDSYRRQIDLMQGEQVQIVGQESSFYRVLPPVGAYVFLPPGSVRPVVTQTDGAAEVTGWKRRSIAATEVTGQGQTRSDRTSIEIDPLSDSDAAKQAVETGGKGSILQPTSAVLRAAEKRLAEAQQLPLEQQPISDLLTDYEAIADDASLSLVDTRIVAMRVAQLKKRMVLIKSLADITAARQEHQAIGQFIDQLPAELPKQRYDLRGVLRASRVYNGENLPRLYRVTEADGQRVIAYARMKPILNPAPLLGQYVGMVGQPKYDSALRLEILEVDHIDLISSTAAR